MIVLAVYIALVWASFALGYLLGFHHHSRARRRWVKQRLRNADTI